MKLKKLMLPLLLLTFQAVVNAQRTYWRIPNDLFEPGKFKGITLELDSGNKLVVYTNNTVTIGNNVDFRDIMKTFFDNYDVIKDTVDEEAPNKIHYFYNPGGKNGLTVVPGSKLRNVISVVDGKSFRLKSGMDTINIYPRKNNSNLESAIFSFQVKKVDDLRIFLTSNLINEFITKVDEQIKQGHTHYKPAAKGYRSIADGSFPSLFSGSFTSENNVVQGHIKEEKRSKKNLAYSVSADLQNYKSYAAPSFNASLDFYLKGVMYREYLRLALYWQPVFLFDKMSDGGMRAKRNDFVGLLYEYRRGSTEADKLNFYAPISIAYLVRKSGDFFEKNTFNFGIGGVKYGALTLRPFMYFNNFFKDVTPSVQLSVGWGR